MKLDLQELEKENVREIARKALAEIESDNEEGLLRAEDVVDAARHPDHALHPYFTWEDSVAAEKWRLVEARQIIRKIYVTLPDGDNEIQVPKYVSLYSDRKREGGGYRRSNEVANNAEWLAELEETAKKDIEGVLQRYELLKDFCAKARKFLDIKPTKPRKRPQKG